MTPVAAELPFGLAMFRCADTAGLVACVDEPYAANGRCTETAADVDPIFGHFTALPPANDYEALCTTPSTECDGSASELRFTVDEAGNALVPMDYRGVLLRPSGIPIARLLRGATDIEAFSGTGASVVLPSDEGSTACAECAHVSSHSSAAGASGSRHPARSLRACRRGQAPRLEADRRRRR